MTIDFHDGKNKHTYAARTADHEWIELMRPYVGKNPGVALDIGCGGGIYSKALADLGASRVIGMDFSRSNLDGARDNCSSYDNITFMQGDALDTGLPEQSVDLILERALIHHITDLDACFRETSRVLKPGGLIIVQDRTQADCLLPGSVNHIRGYFFERYPRLIQKETGRRHTSLVVAQSLSANQFEQIEEISFWETRRTYHDIAELEQDLLNRTGRSILHDLNDHELGELVAYILEKLQDRQDDEIKEQDRWTLWIAKRKSC
ncbi:methyltransferase domain-containing protein [Paenibacillus sp. N3/727]|uniref:class I SAM-dependent methyltransferase n=1 Tax=Paenibacillus sp. N3/727 TaxID=2925845 RepID=UPI001F5350FE|nr:class I SAM-dependent methyltransferase [Paenibacillus sp. N3/727]UNK16825.1 methyltransferase domain-containing protein [Paenibacillus sp. N3/727]